MRRPSLLFWFVFLTINLLSSFFNCKCDLEINNICNLIKILDCSILWSLVGFTLPPKTWCLIRITVRENFWYLIFSFLIIISPAWIVNNQLLIIILKRRIALWRYMFCLIVLFSYCSLLFTIYYFVSDSKKYAVLWSLTICPKA